MGFEPSDPTSGLLHQHWFADGWIGAVARYWFRGEEAGLNPVIPITRLCPASSYLHHPWRTCRHQTLRIEDFNKKARDAPEPSDGDCRSKARAGGFGNRLRQRLFSLSFRFSGRFALQQFKQGFHLCHDTSHFACFGEKTVFHHSLVHFTQFLADVAQVAYDLLTLRLRHR